MTREAARQRRANDVAKRRAAEVACAADFLRSGDTIGFHAKRCVFGVGDACCRQYDPGPVPDDVRLYEGTSLGALWGLNTLQAWQLAGWNIIRRGDQA
jgi:hypothetical protein